MTPMLEKAARAVDPWAFDLDNRHLSPEYRQGLATDIARAVLLAVREPDLAMRRVSTFKAAEFDWPAMIDAILSGEGGE